ncbi:Trinucleotide Repeat-Containing 6B Protein [Manis pentadactyla]|nr:Trinucleotide Repeat-Containing 6B Protein [Manis pentadactyla]
MALKGDRASGTGTETLEEGEVRRLDSRLRHFERSAEVGPVLQPREAVSLTSQTLGSPSAPYPVSRSKAVNPEQSSTRSSYQIGVFAEIRRSSRHEIPENSKLPPPSSSAPLPNSPSPLPKAL